MDQAKEHKSFPAFGVKLLDMDQGIVEHIVAVMGNIDRGNDVIHPGAFSKSLMERGPRVKVLDQHNAQSVRNIVGKPMELREVGRLELPPELLAQYPDATGALVAKTQFLLDTPEGRGVFDRIKSGAVDEYSIGYDPITADYSTVDRPEGKQTIRNLREVRLWEYSPVVWAMNPATTTLSAKGAEPTEDKPDPADYETEGDWMAACVPVRVEEGNDQDQAVAACAGMWAEKDDDKGKRRRRRKIPAAGTGSFAVVLDGTEGPEEVMATWTAAYINDLADSCFLYIESGKDKDEQGKTVPRSARHFPYKDADGKIDLPHVRDAIGRIPQSNAPGLDDAKKNSLQERARRILEDANKTDDADHEGKAGRRVRKTKLEEARGHVAALVEFLKWADYNDESETPDEGDEESKPKSAAGPDLHPRQKQAMIEKLKLEQANMEVQKP